MGEQAGFGDRLAAQVAATSPLCAGLDPSAALLERWGLPDGPHGLEVMGRALIEAVGGVAAAIKPQVAFFERHGAAGIAALELVIEEAHRAGLMVVADAKRGDIDSTMAAYGSAWLDASSSLCVDALTVVAYLGLGAMEAVVEQATLAGRGLFVVVASSNPEGRSIQEAVTAGGDSVEASLLSELARRNGDEIEQLGRSVGSLGAVVGATRQAGRLDLPSLNGPFLVPGVGAQGATPRDVGELFEGCMPGTVLVNASRSILAAGPSVSALATAASELAGELTRSVP